jgi:hypothetical protein
MPKRRAEGWRSHRVVMKGKEGLEPWVRRSMAISVED